MSEKAPDRGKIDLAGLAVHGSVTRATLLGAGVGRRAIQQALTDGRLHRVHAGVYAVGRPLTTPLEHANAAVLACGRRAALGGLSCLALYGVVEAWPRRPVVLVVTRRHRPGIDIHATNTLLRRDVRPYRRIFATTPERALIDAAPSLTDRLLRRAVNGALRRRVTSKTKLRELLARNPRHPGAPRVSRLLAVAARTRSPFEDDFLEFCARHGLPTPITNGFPAGIEADAYFPEERVIVELDSEEWHLDPEVFRSDHARDFHHSTLDLPTVRLIWEQVVKRPDTTAAGLHRILATRRSRAA